MWHPFRRMGKDRAGRESAKAAVEDAKSISQTMDHEINEDKIRANVLREIRERNHLAELFDEAFSMRRRREEEH